ncbi:hypothetical protein VKT23_018539 [Stygiomarasmius scandens]|uniref:Autophagy-related protein 27 n=1 Tax=Marasmiellus scandens TaxID=2682957 RepID=A0ABR1IS55_9AGAR
MHLFYLITICTVFTSKVYAAVLIKNTDEVVIEDQSLSCNFTYEGLKYDLCPLLNTIKSPLKIVLEEETPPTRMNSTYEISLKGELKRDKTLPAESQCPEGTRICLTVSFTRPGHPSTPSQILKVVPVATTEKPRALAYHLPNHENAYLAVRFHGAMYGNMQQRAELRFHCRNDSVEPSKPAFRWNFNGTHVFEWKSRHACPKGTATPKEPPKEPPEEPPNPTPDDPNEPQPEPVPAAPKLRRTFVTLFWCLILLILLLRALTYFRIFSFRSLFRFFPRPRTPSLGRPTDSRLLRWAQQAGFTREDGSETVNSEYSPLSGEEMPLTPTPRTGTFGPVAGKTYGTGQMKNERDPLYEGYD